MASSLGPRRAVRLGRPAADICLGRGFPVVLSRGAPPTMHQRRPGPGSHGVETPDGGRGRRRRAPRTRVPLGSPGRRWALRSFLSGVVELDLLSRIILGIHLLPPILRTIFANLAPGPAPLWRVLTIPALPAPLRTARARIISHMWDLKLSLLRRVARARASPPLPRRPWGTQRRSGQQGAACPWPSYLNMTWEVPAMFVPSPQPQEKSGTSSTPPSPKRTCRSWMFPSPLFLKKCGESCSLYFI